jgi:membrane protein implicated in regulation of membrane protease activity
MPTIVDVLLEAQPESLEVMRQRVQALAAKEDPKIGGAPSFVRLQKISQLHFMSMQIFEDGHFDPLLVFENNFDGTPGAYWPVVLAQFSDDLRSIFACTKDAKLEQWSTLFKPGNTDSLMPFLVAHSCSPSAGHFGAVANSLPRITRDRGVFDDLQVELGAAALKYRKLNAAGVQQALRTWAYDKYDWLEEPENPTTRQAICSYKWSTVLPLIPWVVLALILLAVLVLYQSGILPWHGMGIHSLIKHFIVRYVAALALIVVSFVLALILAGVGLYKALSRLEGSDFTQYDPQLSPKQMKLFAAQEDEIVQNHLASMVLVKPGMIRGFLIRTALRLLKFGVPIVASDGYLGSMRTIHFAHWTLVGNSGRLLFLSNFDGSWQSYLDDFVDKAAHGLTLAWGNCIGFPRTKNLILEGAAHGTQFKAWARQSQTQSILWYSAYKTLTVNQIIRNAAIVDGLRKTSMQPAEAEQWAQLL